MQDFTSSPSSNIPGTNKWQYNTYSQQDNDYIALIKISKGVHAKEQVQCLDALNWIGMPWIKLFLLHLLKWIHNWNVFLSLWLNTVLKGSCCFSKFTKCPTFNKFGVYTEISIWQNTFLMLKKQSPPKHLNKSVQINSLKRKEDHDRVHVETETLIYYRSSSSSTTDQILQRAYSKSF